MSKTSSKIHWMMSKFLSSICNFTSTDCLNWFEGGLTILAGIHLFQDGLSHNHVVLNLKWLQNIASRTWIWWTTSNSETETCINSPGWLPWLNSLQDPRAHDLYRVQFANLEWIIILLCKLFKMTRKFASCASLVTIWFIMTWLAMRIRFSIEADSPSTTLTLKQIYVFHSQSYAPLYPDSCVIQPLVKYVTITIYLQDHLRNFPGQDHDFLIVDFNMILCALSIRY